MQRILLRKRMFGCRKLLLRRSREHVLL
jgi:hypothetical protein